MHKCFLALLAAIVCSAAIAQKTTDYKDLLPVIDAWLNGQRDFDRLKGHSTLEHEQFQK